MALTFGANPADHGSDASIDDLDPFTLSFWVYPTSNGGNNGLVRKAGPDWLVRWVNFGGINRWNLRVARGAGIAELETDVNFALNTWHFLAFQYRSSTDSIQAFRGTHLGLAAEVAYNLQAPGSGTTGSNAGENLFVGSQGGTGFPGRVAFVSLDAAYLSLGEIWIRQREPWRVGPDTRLHVHYGLRGGTGTQPDLSGHGNHGTIAGGASLARHAPIRVQRPVQTTVFIPATAGIAEVPTLHVIRSGLRA